MALRLVQPRPGDVATKNSQGKERPSCDLLNDTITTINEDNLHLSFNAQDYRSDEDIYEIEDLDATVKGYMESIGSADDEDC
jgi:hypothetical protein